MIPPTAFNFTPVPVDVVDFIPPYPVAFLASRCFPLPGLEVLVR